MRKSTALGVAKNLVRFVERVPIAPESSTREALIDDMSKNKVTWELGGRDVSYWQSAAFVGELEQFFGGKHINQQMVGFLTAIWDEPCFKERTRKGGEVVINNPYFTMLGCCTPNWMNTKLQQDVISDGFTRRTIFVLEDQLNTLNPWPESYKEEEVLLGKLQTEVNRIFQISGKFSFTPEARALWDEQYADIREQAKKFSVKVQHYFSSKHILAQKIAMCISAALRNDRVVDSVILKLAFDFLGESEKRLDLIFSGVGRNELKAYSNKIMNLVHENADVGVTQEQIWSLFYDDLKQSELDESLTALQRSGQLRIDYSRDGSNHRYYPATTRKLEPVASLLELASQVKLSSERLTESSAPSSQERLVDPVTERLLIRQQEREAAQRNGILYQGTLKELIERPFDSSKKAPRSKGA